jgi:hypothetical protein
VVRKVHGGYRGGSPRGQHGDDELADGAGAIHYNPSACHVASAIHCVNSDGERFDKCSMFESDTRGEDPELVVPDADDIRECALGVRVACRTSEIAHSWAQAMVASGTLHA